MGVLYLMQLIAVCKSLEQMPLLEVQDSNRADRKIDYRATARQWKENDEEFEN